MKVQKKFVIILMTFCVFAFFSVTVYATHDFGSGKTEIRIEGNAFEIWGYMGDTTPS